MQTVPRDRRRARWVTPVCKCNDGRRWTEGKDTVADAGCGWSLGYDDFSLQWTIQSRGCLSQLCCSLGWGVQYFGLWGWWWRMKGWEIGITIENENSGGAVPPHKLLLSFAPACYNNNAKPCHFSFKTSIGYWIDQWYYFFLISMFLLVIAFSTRTSNKFGKKGK